MFGFGKKAEKPGPEVVVQLNIRLANGKVCSYITSRRDSSLIWHYKDFYKWFVCRRHSEMFLMSADNGKHVRMLRRGEIREFWIRKTIEQA